MCNDITNKNPHIPHFDNSILNYIIQIVFTQCVVHKYDTCDTDTAVNPFKPEFTIVIFTHYKPRIAAAILDL